jgi:hypothetical protein
MDDSSTESNCQPCAKPLKFLFSSSDFSIIHRIREKLEGYDIRYEVRGVDPEAAAKAAPYVELWVGRGDEFAHAVHLLSSYLECVKIQPAAHA